ncbi:CvpA family protein [Marinilabilia rubra]|uniref:Colicin V production protein n=1 Tax=Marinilabilia rubra TaxID=2162893 RepID=A0A2U2B998_9BACT|nr:CvpA family protein [Marinilabilia rubra]PWD99651.1 colicin V production protein [Marinilabilia rubra]
MSYFDIIAGILLILAALKGLKNGFIKELAGLAALLLGIIFAVQFSDVMADFLSGFFFSRHMGIIAFLLTFVLVVVVIHLLANLLHTLINAVALGIFNKLLGLVFGIIKAGFLISIILLGLEVFGLEKSIVPPGEQQRSKLYPPVKNAAPMIFDFFEKDLDQLFAPGKEEGSPVTVLPELRQTALLFVFLQPFKWKSAYSPACIEKH